MSEGRQVDHQSVAARLAAVRGRIADAVADAGRDAREVRLLAVSKGHAAAAVRELATGGQRRFGESYVNEALPKIESLRDLGLEWYFLGPLQRNKTRSIAESFGWVLSLASERVAHRLDRQRPPELGPLQVCIQVNLDGDERRSGIRLDELARLADVVAELPNLTLRGLMTIPRAPAPGHPPSTAFHALGTVFAEFVERGHAWDTLSMGMSCDYTEAIRAGSTQVRIGTALFGPRPPRPSR